MHLFDESKKFLYTQHSTVQRQQNNINTECYFRLTETGCAVVTHSCQKIITNRNPWDIFVL